MPSKQRDSSIELLRIFAMLIIITHHAIVHGLFEHLDFQSEFAIMILQGLSWLGSFGNLIYIFISAYFLAGAQFSAKKILKLWLELFFYSATISLIFYFLKVPCFFTNHMPGKFEAEFDSTLHPPTLKAVSSAFMPFFRSASWFVSCYILFYIHTPFLNKMIGSLSQKEHLALAIISTMYATVIPMIPFNAISHYASGNLVIFITVFFVASYLKKYPLQLLESSRLCFILATTLFSLFVLWRITIVYIFANGFITIPSLISQKSNILNVFTSMKSFPLLLLTIFTFFGFKGLAIKPSRTINAISGTTLGIYLIHDNTFIRYFLWFRVFKLSSHFYKAGFFLYFIFTILSVFIVSALTDLLRQTAFCTLSIIFDKIKSFPQRASSKIA